MLLRSPKELALLVINRRKALKLSRTKIGDLVGLKQKTISAFENKPENAKLETVFQILSAVNLNVSAVAKNKTFPLTKSWQ